jgi:hypothetical protein
VARLQLTVFVEFVSYKFDNILLFYSFALLAGICVGLLLGLVVFMPQVNV